MPPDDKTPVRNNTVLVSAPLGAPRQTIGPSVSTVAMNRPRSLTAPELSSASSINGANGTTAHRTQTPTQTSPVDISQITPVSFADRQAYPPEYLAAFQTPEASNDSKWLNQSSTTTTTTTTTTLATLTTLLRRHPDPSNYGRLSGPMVKVIYTITWDDMSAVSDITWMGPGAFPTIDCALDVMDMVLEIAEAKGLYMAAGIATCDGPALVFHAPKCWTAWNYVASLENKFRARGLPLLVRNDRIMTDQSVTGVDPATAQMCREKIERDPEDAAGATASNAVTVITMRDSQGVPEATLTADIINRVDSSGSTTPVATVIRSTSREFTAITITSGGTTTTATARLTTLTNSRGQPTATAALIPLRDPSNGATTGTSTRTISVSSETALTLRDSRGQPTATISVRLPPPDSYFTLTGPNGNPILTITRTYPLLPTSTPSEGSRGGGGGGVPREEDSFHPISSTEYTAVLVLPVLLAIIAAILAQSVHADLQALLPFHSLTAASTLTPWGGEGGQRGVTARESLTLITSGIPGFANSFRFLTNQRDPLSLFSYTLIVVVAVVTSLSSEAVGIQLHGECTKVDFRGCYMGIAVFLGPSRAIQALLGLGVIMVVGMGLVLGKWRTGVLENPLSIATMARLVQSPRLREGIREVRSEEGDFFAEIRNREVTRQLEGYRFAFGCQQGREGYGIVVFPTTGQDMAARMSRKHTAPARPPARTRRKQPNMFRRTRERLIDGLGLLLLWGLAILITYYNTTQYHESGFEKFMNNQNFGVRTLFTGVGVLVSLLWNHLFSRKSSLVQSNLAPWNRQADRY